MSAQYGTHVTTQKNSIENLKKTQVRIQKGIQNNLTEIPNVNSRKDSRENSLGNLLEI